MYIIFVNKIFEVFLCSFHLKYKEMEIIKANCNFLFFYRFKDLSKVNNSLFVVPVIGGKTADRR